MFSLMGCTSSKIQERIDEVEETNKQNTEQSSKKDKIGKEGDTDNKHEDNSIEDDEPVELSEEQKDALAKAQQNTTEEALFKNDLDIRKELKLDIPNEKNAFTDPNEFAQYVSYLFFAYHTGQMKAEDFYLKMKPHLHEGFIELLPNEEENRVLAFKSIQELFIKHLTSPIATYTITDLKFQERYGEAMFYRKYETKRNDRIYYVTTFKKEGDVWKLFDDNPAPPYIVETEEIINNTKKEQGEEN